MPRRKRTRTTTTRRRPTLQPITPAQDRRLSLLRLNGVDLEAIRRRLQRKHIQITRQAIGAVIRNKFVNEDIIAAFCELTSTTRAEAWPDVPPLDAETDPARTGTDE